ncbi:MAG: hypothetical protein KME21_18685 [Desmonostoc vinosum HA7617-LM4]|jgi:hypothetical protein|nr:hypothetical protein [Desmonostoc vinosum HA7617-LM4]
MRKTTVLTLALISLAALPVVAQFSDTSQVGEVWVDFQSYSLDFQNYLRNNARDTLKNVEPQTQSAISGASGELNIPDPIAAGQRVRSDIFINSISDRFENNSVVRANLVNNEINRLITRGAVVGALGDAGQIRTKAKLRNTEIALRNIAGFAEEAEEKSQELLDKLPIIDYAKLAADPGTALLSQLLNTNQAQILKIQQEQAKIVGETLAQTIQNNQSIQYSNLNLANISQQVEESNRARRVDASTEAARLLRATSQVELFGKTNEN